MAMSSDEEEELFDVGLASDHASLINPKEKDDSDVIGTPVHNKRILKTVVLFSSFISLGLAVSILGPTIPNLILQVGTGYSQLSFIFLTRGFGYMVGAVVAGFAIERLNPFRVLGCSLAVCAVAMFLMPAVQSLNLLILLFILAGFAMGCLDTGGNVICIQIWGPKSAAYMQALHFSFAIGALMAPLLAKPFIGLPFAGNETAFDVVCDLGQIQTSHSLITEHIDSNILSSVNPLTLPPQNILTTPGKNTIKTPKPILLKTVPPKPVITPKPVPPKPVPTPKPVLTTEVVTPTTLVPTTHAPTTSVPTTHAPTTSVPTTHAPTTSVPTTHAPTTSVPIKIESTTNQIFTAQTTSTTLFQLPVSDATTNTDEPHVTTKYIIPPEPITTNVPTPEIHPEKATPHNATSPLIVTTEQTQLTTTPKGSGTTTYKPPELKESTSSGITPVRHSISSEMATSIAEQTTGEEDWLKSITESTQEEWTEGEITITENFDGSTIESESTIEKGKRSTVVEVTTQKTTPQPPPPPPPVKPPKHPNKHHRRKGKSVKTVSRRDIGWMSTGDLTMNKTEDAVENDGAKLWNVYGILFFVITLNSIAFFYLSFKGGNYKQSHYAGANKSVAHQDDATFRLQLLSIMFVFYFLYVGSEVAYGSFIFSYGRFSDLKLDKDQASLLNSLYWGTFAAFRGLAIILARCTSPLVMLLFDLLGCGVASLILLVFKGTNALALWAGTAILGASMASLFPSGLSWLGNYIEVTGSAASVLVVGASAGEMAIPFVVGHFFPDWCHPENEGQNIQVLMYTMFAVTIFTSIIFLVAYRLAKKKGDRYKGHHLVPESSMMLELQSAD